MFVFHFYINGVNITCIGNRNTVGIFINYIPTAFLSIRRNMTILYVLENTLMEVSDIIVIRLVPLPKNFVADNFIPSRLINGLIKNQFDWVNNVFVEPFQIKRLELFSIFFNSCFHMVCKILFSNKT